MREGRFMKRNRAFTLIELLVVVGIISVLMAVLLPALNRARMQAKAVTCTANMHQVAMAIVMYSADHHGYMTSQIQSFAPYYLDPVTKQPNPDCWITDLLPYVNNN